MTVNKKSPPFQIIRHRGQPRKGQLPDGTWIYAEDKMFIEEYRGFVPTAPYSDHFIYRMPKNSLGSAYMCSCGSPAIIVGISGYVHDASPQGKLMVCMAHSTNGIHLTGGSRWV